MRLLSEEPVGLHSVGDVVFQGVSLPDNPGERQLVHHCPLCLAGVGKAQSWRPDFCLDRLGEGVHVVLVPQVVEHQPGVDPLDEEDEVRGVGQLQSVDLREGEDTDVDCDQQSVAVRHDGKYLRPVVVGHLQHVAVLLV